MVSLAILLIGFIVSASSCSTTKSGYQRRNDTAVNETKRNDSKSSDKAQSTREQGERAPQANKAANNSPYKSNQNDNKAAPKGEHVHDNGLGNAIGGFITYILNGLSGNR